MKILIFNPFGIGDVLFSTPILKALKKRFPECLIGYICNKRTYELIVNNPMVSRVFVFEKDDYRREWNRSKIRCIKDIISFLKGLKGEHFDMVFDLSLGYFYSMLFLAIGMKERVGFNYKNRGRFLTKKLDIKGFDNKHVIEYYLDLVRLIGIEPEDKKIELHISQKDRTWTDDFLSGYHLKPQEIVIGIIPGCGASWGKDAEFRRWGRRNFAAVADKLSERHYARMILFGSPDEVDMCDEILRMMKSRPISACGKTSLGEFFALMERCDLIITNDGGPLHAAVGLGVKTVSIFGPVDEMIYGPYPYAKEHIVISNKDLPCRPCYRSFKYALCDAKTCLNSIAQEDVLKGTEKVLRLVDKAS